MFRWNATVEGYLRRLGRDPAYSCPLIERSAFEQFDALASVLDIRPATVLDIGCGLALLDVLIARAYRPTKTYLLDGNGAGERARGFKPGMQPWADVDMGVLMFEMNAPITCMVESLPAAPFFKPADLILSSRSWCHHYPVEVYLSSVVKSLNPGGRLVVDIRRGTGGLQKLRDAGFVEVAAVPDPSRKCARVMFRRR